MEWDHDIDISTRKMSSQLIIKRTLARGWKICGFKSNPAIFLIYIPGKENPVKIFSASPPMNSLPATKIAKDKYITNQILNQANIPVPKELLINHANYNLDEVDAFIKSCGKVVVKPLDASHGNGITMTVNSLDRFKNAVEEVKSYTKNKNVVIQEELSGIDIRVLCINYKYISALSRIPASIIGDGEHSVRELIEITNNSDERGQNYRSKLNVIPMNKVERHLSSDELSYIPDSEVEVQVIGVSNIGMGGVRKNIENLMPKALIELAIEVSKLMELPVCGVDFMVKHEPNVNSTFEELQPKVIEVNDCPMLTVYEDINSVEEQEVIDNYLDFIASSVV